MADGTIDALVPREVARRADDAGVKKVNLNWVSSFALAVLAH